MENILNRSILLYQQKRYKEAEKLLNDLLAQDPENTDVLLNLAEVSLELKKYDKANQLTDTVLAIYPNNDILYNLKARILIHQDKDKEAEEYIDKAISLDPTEEAHITTKAALRLDSKDYKNALNYANKALELDPESVLALNIRSTALIKLNKKEESYQTIEGALREDPDNAYTHANYGWGLLEKGNHKKALEHFKESLKIDPNESIAQAGMAEAIKAKYWIYRMFLKYAFWIANKAKKQQIIFIIGSYVLYRFLARLALNNEMLRPFLTPIVVLMVLFFLSTWFIPPLSNIFLRINPYGKYLLSDKEKLSSNFTITSIVVGIISFILYFITLEGSFLILGVLGITMIIPLNAMYEPSKPKNAKLYYAFLLLGIGLAAIIAKITGGNYYPFYFAYMIAFIAYAWLSNYFAIKESK